MWARPLIVLSLVALAACKPLAAGDTVPATTDTDTSDDPDILPIDTAPFIPQDTSATGPPNIEPENYVLMNQIGQWRLSSADPPYGNLVGDLHITEYIDALDTALPVYECNVVYALTGSIREQHGCTECDFVYDVEYFVNSGDPTTCHDPDAPVSGDVLQLGFVNSDSSIWYDYQGTEVWIPWYDADKIGSVVDFEWIATLAIEVVDTGETQ